MWSPFFIGAASAALWPVSGCSVPRNEGCSGKERSPCKLTPLNFLFERPTTHLGRRRAQKDRRLFEQFSAQLVRDVARRHLYSGFDFSNFLLRSSLYYWNFAKFHTFLSVYLSPHSDRHSLDLTKPYGETLSPFIFITSCPARRCSGIRAPLNFVASLLWLR